jgi:hypothetical protein
MVRDAAVGVHAAVVVATDLPLRVVVGSFSAGSARLRKPEDDSRKMSSPIHQSGDAAGSGPLRRRTRAAAHDVRNDSAGP